MREIKKKKKEQRSIFGLEFDARAYSFRYSQYAKAVLCYKYLIIISNDYLKFQKPKSRLAWVRKYVSKRWEMWKKKKESKKMV